MQYHVLWHTLYCSISNYVQSQTMFQFDLKIDEMKRRQSVDYDQGGNAKKKKN